MLAPANTAREIVASEQLAAREFFVDVEHPGRGTLRLPGAVRAASTSRDPDATAIARARPGAAARRAHGRGAGRDRRRPRDALERLRAEGVVMTDLLAGTTILEFGGGAAGPVATRYFADHGADRDPRRVAAAARTSCASLKLTPNTPGGLDGGEHFAVLNANKLSVALNLSTPEGVAVARRLALRADAVAENFAPGAMAKWGLDYAIAGAASGPTW